jgi:hypothetical protein
VASTTATHVAATTAAHVTATAAATVLSARRGGAEGKRNSKRYRDKEMFDRHERISWGPSPPRLYRILRVTCRSTPTY